MRVLEEYDWPEPVAESMRHVAEYARRGVDTKARDPVPSQSGGGGGRVSSGEVHLERQDLIAGLASLVGNEAAKMKSMSRLLGRAGTPGHPGALLYMALLIGLVVPVLTCGLCAGVGALLAHVEGWTWRQGFYYFGGNVTGLGNPLVSNTPTSDLGRVVDMNCSIILLIFVSLVTGAVSNSGFVEKLSDTFLGSRKKDLIAVFVLLPAGIHIACGILAFILHKLDGNMTMGTAHLYVISTTCGLGNPLTNASPAHDSTRTAAMIVGIWQLAIVGTIVGFSGAIPAVQETADAFEDRVQRYVVERWTAAARLGAAQVLPARSENGGA